MIENMPKGMSTCSAIDIDNLALIRVRYPTEILQQSIPLTHINIYPSLLSAYTPPYHGYTPHTYQPYTLNIPHSYQHIPLTPINIYTSLLSAYAAHSYQHIPLTPISIYPSLISAYTPHSYQHISFTPINMYDVPLTPNSIYPHSYQRIPLIPISNIPLTPISPEGFRMDDP